MNKSNDYVQCKDVESAKAAFAFGNIKFKCAVCGRIHDTEDAEEYDWCLFNSRLIVDNEKKTDKEVIYPEKYYLCLEPEVFEDVFFKNSPRKCVKAVEEAKIRLAETKRLSRLVYEDEFEENVE